jgi:xanthine/CO dehydrogenase XdhC/CoxF family maturation factor
MIRQVTDRPDERMALATLVHTQGSTYRKPGARLLVGNDGNTIGVLSGGCLEEEIAERGQAVIQSGVPKLLQFDTRRLYGCNGQLEVLVERLSPASHHDNLLVAVGERLAARESCRIRTRFEKSGKDSLLGSDLLPQHSAITEQPGALIHLAAPSIRLLLFGSGPEIGPVTRLAEELGWLPEQIVQPIVLGADFTPDDRTVAVVMTHNFGRDLAALSQLLPMRLPYVGLLGPKKRRAELISQLLDYQSLDDDYLSTVHAPAGLDIGSEAPEEIALSIISEIAAVLSRRTGGFLRERLRISREHS